MSQYLIPDGKTPTLANWCDRAISPRMYWLHNEVGGNGWAIRATKAGSVLEVSDPELLTFAILKFGPPK